MISKNRGMWNRDHLALMVAISVTDVPFLCIVEHAPCVGGCVGGLQDTAIEWNSMVMPMLIEVFGFFVWF